MSHEELRRLAEAANSTSCKAVDVDNYRAATRPDVVLALLADLERKDALLRRAGEVLKAEYAAEYDEALELAVLAAIEKELAP